MIWLPHNSDAVSHHSILTGRLAVAWTQQMPSCLRALALPFPCLASEVGLAQDVHVSAHVTSSERPSQSTSSIFPAFLSPILLYFLL